MKIQSQLRKKLLKHMESSRGSHDLEHTLRVYKLSEHIGEKENANMKVLLTATYLHDIARRIQDESNGKICHAQLGAKMSINILRELSADEKFITQVAHCVETHRYRTTKAPETLEAKILFDADKLDSIGAVGIARAFLFAGEIGAKLHNKDSDLKNTKQYTKEATAYREYMLKLKDIKDRMMTKEGKKLAQERHDFMVNFFEKLNMEYEGVN